VVLAIVSACALEASSRFLAVQGPIAQSLLVIAWTAAAARRLVAWRHGHGPVPVERLSQGLTIVACAVPIVVMQSLNPSSREWPAIALASFPSSLHLAGALFIAFGVLAPFWVPRSRMGVEFYARAIGFILLTASPLVAAVVAGCVMLRCRADRGRPAGSAAYL
jgi:hypothetical protein